MREMMHTQKSLLADLSRMGLTGNETILVHSSMKSIGEVEGRADAVLDALSRFFQDGLLLFPSFTYASVNGNEGHDFYDVASSPACTGILPELFWHRPGVLRSLHPTHSIAALGKKAAEFIADHDTFNTAFNRKGPFGRLLDWNGKVLLFGVTLDRCTFIHALEEWAGVPMLSKEPIKLISRNHQKIDTPVDLYWHTGAHSEVFDRILPVFLEQNVVKPVTFGDASTLLVDCKMAYDTLVPILKQNPSFFKNRD